MSRDEEILTAIANGETTETECLSRREVFLKAIANGEGTENLPEPMSREEELYLQIAELGIGGGSSEAFSALVDGSLTEVNEDTLSGVTSIRSGAFQDLSLTTVSVPSNVTSIGDSAFANSGISELTLAEGVETVGDNAFANNNISNVTIPASVTSIGDSAFADCSSLTEVTMSGTTPPTVAATSFPNSVTDTYVPYGAYDDYTEQWSDYSDKITRLPAIPSSITVTVNNYLGELVSGASVTVTAGENTYNGITDSNGVCVIGDLQPATYTISVADLEGFKTPSSSEVVVNEDTQNTVTITYLEKPAFNPIFGENTWEQIATASEQIVSENMASAEVEATYGWKLGDSKTETLSTGEVIELQIIGYNHDDLADETGKAGITLQMKNCLRTKYRIHTAGLTNKGGWGESEYRTQTLPTLKTTLSSELQSVLKQVNKKYANGSDANFSAIETAVDDLFLLSEYELFGTVSKAQNGAEEGVQYEYWIDKEDADRRKYWDNSSDADNIVDVAIAWWLRSVYVGNNQCWCSVHSEGRPSGHYPTGDNGTAFALCV